MYSRHLLNLGYMILEPKEECSRIHGRKRYKKMARNIQEGKSKKALSIHLTPVFVVSLPDPNGSKRK